MESKERDHLTEDPFQRKLGHRERLNKFYTFFDQNQIQLTNNQTPFIQNASETSNENNSYNLNLNLTSQNAQTIVTNGNKTYPHSSRASNSTLTNNKNSNNRFRFGKILSLDPYTKDPYYAKSLFIHNGRCYSWLDTEEKQNFNEDEKKNNFLYERNQQIRLRRKKFLTEKNSTHFLPTFTTEERKLFQSLIRSKDMNAGGANTFIATHTHTQTPQTHQLSGGLEESLHLFKGQAKGNAFRSSHHRLFGNHDSNICLYANHQEYNRTPSDPITLHNNQDKKDNKDSKDNIHNDNKISRAVTRGLNILKNEKRPLYNIVTGLPLNPNPFESLNRIYQAQANLNECPGE